MAYLIKIKPDLKWFKMCIGDNGAPRTRRWCIYYVCCTPVLVSLAAITKYPRFGVLSHRKLFLTVLQAGHLRSECQRDEILVRFLFLACRQCLPATSSVGVRGVGGRMRKHFGISSF